MGESNDLQNTVSGLSSCDELNRLCVVGVPSRRRVRYRSQAHVYVVGSISGHHDGWYIRLRGSDVLGSI